MVFRRLRRKGLLTLWGTPFRRVTLATHARSYMHLRMFSRIGETFSLSRLAKRQISAILRIVPKLTAEMPNAACGLDAGRRHHWSVGRVTPGRRRTRAGIRSTRMPAFFYRRISIRMTMTITMTVIRMDTGLHLLARNGRLGCDQRRTRHSAVSALNIARKTTNASQNI